MSLLNLIRYKNLLLIALVQLAIKYGLFEAIGAKVSLSDFQFAILVFVSLCLAAAGNIINDIYDVDVDRINRPKKQIVDVKISEKQANIWFIIFNILGVLAGFILSNSIGRPGFAAIFILISASLYIYASYLKKILLIGNLLISMLVAASILIVGVFDIVPAIDTDEMGPQVKALTILLHYSFFAFYLNLIREIVKDIEDINGDKMGDIKSLPIAIGRKRATRIVLVLAGILSLIVIWYMYSYLYYSEWLVLYFLFLIVAPLFYFCIKAWKAETPKEIAFLSFLLKLIMLFGVCSIIFYPIN